MSHIRRVAVLWETITGYVQAALSGLLADPEVVLFVVQRSNQANAPFQPSMAERTTFIYLHDRPDQDTTWIDALMVFAPDVALITGSKDPGYQQAASRLHRSGVITVWASDRLLRSWWRDAYQAFEGRIRGRWQGYDLAFVPGKASSAYARRIGFAPDRIIQGLYTCDTKLFRPVGNARHTAGCPSTWPQVFLFLGQFIERKGIDLLLEAYRRYRNQTLMPWELWCVGSGPLATDIAHAQGVLSLHFLSSPECAEVMGQVGALILPSLWDHWGVVIHEATSAGLPVIASSGCGAVHDLVESGRNGYVFPVGNVDKLVQSMLELSKPDQARRMGAESLLLASDFGPERFAAAVLEQIPARMGR